MKNKNLAIIIPARYDSNRLPGKPLVDICGKPMIQWVYEQCKKVKITNNIIIATDDKRIKNIVEAFGGACVITSRKHKSGTERVTEVAENLNVKIIINVQGDEPLINPNLIRVIFRELVHNPKVPIVTLKSKIYTKSEYDNQNVVKVVTDRYGNALYFSRSKIPYQRKVVNGFLYKHIGIYGYRKEFLMKMKKIKNSFLEKSECLEQLKILEEGYDIRVCEVKYDSISVDTPEDLQKVRLFVKHKKRNNN